LTVSWQRRLLWLLIFCLLICFAACTTDRNDFRNDPRQSSDRQLIVGEPYRSLQNAPLYVALAKDFFAQNQLDVIIEQYNDTDEAAQELLTARKHFLVSTSDKIFYLYQQEQKDFLVYAQLSKSNAYYLLARENKPLEWPNLKNKVILGYRGGDLPWVLLQAELRKKNLNPFLSYSPVDNLAYDLVPAVFRAGSGDFLLAEEPAVSALEADEKGYILSSLRLTAGELPAHTVLVSKEFYNNYPEQCRSFLSALQQAADWLEQESPAEIADCLKDFFPEYPEVILQRAAGRYKNNDSWSALQPDQEAWQKLQEIMIQEKELRQIIPAEELFASTLLPELPENSE